MANSKDHQQSHDVNVLLWLVELAGGVQRSTRDLNHIACWAL